jgi:hypothetical protein
VLVRFSSHPSIALPGVDPGFYGAPFKQQVKSMLGSMLSVPSRETVTGFLLLSLVAAGDGGLIRGRFGNAFQDPVLTRVQTRNPRYGSCLD